MRNLPPVRAKKVRSPNRDSSLLEAVEVPEEQYMNEKAIMWIINALGENEESIGLDWPDQEKEEVMFSRWALDEILLLVWDHPWTLASETIEKFAIRLTFFAAEAASEGQRRIFTVAAETAWELLEEIEALERL